jgi:hypothetical protein
MDVFNLGLYHTFEPKGRNVLGMYRGKTIILLGNEIHHNDNNNSNNGGSQDPISCLDLLDTGEITKLVSEGTSILVSDVEMARGRDLRRWLSDVVHRTYCTPTSHLLMDSDNILKCLRQTQKNDTKYIMPIKGPWEKQADKMAKALDKQFPDRRFLVSQQDSTKISVREGLGYDARVSVMFRLNTTDETGMMQYTLVSLLPFRTRLSLLWPLLKDSKQLEIMEYLTLSITNSLIIEQRSNSGGGGGSSSGGGTPHRNEFLQFDQLAQFDTSSIVFITTILSSLSRRGLRRKSTDEIQLFLSQHYHSPELIEMANSRLRWTRRLSVRDIRTRISQACNLDIAEYDSRILNAREIDTEIHVLRNNMTRGGGREEELLGKRGFESRFPDCMDELLEFIPSSLTRYVCLLFYPRGGDVDGRNSSATLLPEPEIQLQDFLKEDPFKNW